MGIDKPKPNYHEITRRYWNIEGKKGWKKEDEEPSAFFNQFYATHKTELGHDVLDVGSGNGRHMITLAREGFNVTGLEPSEGMIKVAERRLAEQNLKANLVQGQSAELLFKDNSFDFVISTGAIHHNKMEDVQKSFKEISRVLKPKKYFLFTGRSTNDNLAERDVVEDFRQNGFGFTAVDKEGGKQGIVQHYFNAEELKQLGEENGLEIVVEPYEEIKPGPDPEKQTARISIVYKKKG